MLLEEERTFANLRTSFKYIIKALSLALGNDTPLSNSCDNKVLYSGGSLAKTSVTCCKIEMSLHSLPKATKSTIPRESRILIAPEAKFSALEIA